MVNARPGYWDVDRCAWVGAEPAYVVPVSRTASANHGPIAIGSAEGPTEVELATPRDAADADQVTAESV